MNRTFKDDAGVGHELRIGVISFVPPQIMAWDKAHLEGKLEASDIVLGAKRLVPELRSKSDILSRCATPASGPARTPKVRKTPPFTSPRCQASTSS